ncbi:MAG TPA: hypothetical protein VFW64_09160 [Pseudonocardiaceae bacterium]|nr:hypothetical protein [Pseudonocardiaceae bacterium]
MGQTRVPSPDPRPRGLDPAAQVTGVLALAALTLALIEGGHVGLSPLVIAAAVVFVASVAGFVAIERWVPAPMLPLSLFRKATFSGGNAVGPLINLGFYGELFVINLYFQQVLGYSALLAGLALLPRWAWLRSGPYCLAGSPLAPAAHGPPRATAIRGDVGGGVWWSGRSLR